MNYPNGKKRDESKNIISFSNRGMSLEHDINASNEYYLKNDMAIIHKKPTPIQIVKVDYPSRNKAKIVEAYFKVPSTTDYNGIFEGKYIDFEAKECSSLTSFPFKDIHPHQVKHLENVYRHGAICFIILRFTKLDETYLIKAKDFIDFYYDNKGRQSLPITWVKNNAKLINRKYNIPVDYLSIVKQDLGVNNE